MGEVVEEEGNTVFTKVVASVQNCEDLCDKNEDCHSFRYCKRNDDSNDDSDDSKNECFLKDKVLTGNEPSIFVEHCASYYTAGSAFDECFLN